MLYTLAQQIISKIGQAAEIYHRLVLLVGPAGSGKTKALRLVSDKLNSPLLNTNLLLSQRMLDLTNRERILQLPKLLAETVYDAGDNIVLLDNTEMLFDVDLKQDPLRLLQRISRSRTIVASWVGSIDDMYLTYAEPNHPEFRRYQAEGFFIVDTQGVTR